MNYISAIVDVPTMQTNQPYTYRVPEKFTDLISPGMRIVVPFGKGNRRIQGFVTTVLDTLPTNVDVTKVKAVDDIIELEPVLNTELLALGQWLATENFSFQISVFQTMLPNVMRAKYTKTLQLVDQTAVTDERVQQLFADRFEVPFAVDEIDEELLPVLKRYQMSKAIQVGYHVENQARVKTAPVIEVLAEASFYEALRQQLPATAKKKARILTFLMQQAQGKVLLARAVMQQLHVTSADLNTAAAAGWLRRDEIETYRLPQLSQPVARTEPLTLNAEQQLAYDKIATTLTRAGTDTFLLEGITGSGKTEVYLHAIAETISQGKTAMMLVPEITLTPQMVRRVQGRFGDTVAVMHSGLSDGERYDEWRRVERDEVNVVVGARSAVFAPLKNIGLIIIDEEHEATYKQDENPRYHARDVALWRARYHGATVVLGSATPSLESRARAQRGVYELLRLTKRAQHNPLPEAVVVDMREVMQNSGEENFSPLLVEKLKDRLDRHEQTVLMLNRRGYANFMMCRDCGYVPRCKNCDLALTVHKETGRLECHYCGYNEIIPQVCANCGSRRISPYGTGTEKIEELLQDIVPDARVIRMDVDTSRKKGATDKMLQSFGDKEADILLGTQMIAKGLDFPDVTLVGVLNADTTLGLPDYRASEKTFQLLTQVAGRAGRADKAGEVVIQTFNPDHYAIQLAREQNYEAFYQTEMQLRHAWNYAPYFYAIQLKFANETEAEAAKVAYATVKWLQNKIAPETVILGPSSGAVRRLKNKYYYRVLIKFKHDEGLEQALLELAEGAQRLAKHGTMLSIDRDPVNFI